MTKRKTRSELERMNTSNQAVIDTLYAGIQAWQEAYDDLLIKNQELEQAIENLRQDSLWGRRY